MPASSIRDLVVHENDIAVATHGRGFWILDDIAPLRQVRVGQALPPVRLFKPSNAYRFRWSKYTDTPLPPDEPAGQNPPDGAIIDYALAAPASEVTLEILDPAGKLVRKDSSADKADPPKDTGNVPWYWIRPPQVLSREPGMHRFVWDLHYTPLPQKAPTFPIGAVPHDTAPDSTSPWVVPGTYTVKLSAGGQSTTQPLVIVMDPRVKTSREDLAQQLALSAQVYEDLKGIGVALDESGSMQEKPRHAKAIAGEEAAATPGGPDTLTSVAASLRALFEALQAADVAPTTQLVAAVEDRHQAALAITKRWEDLRR